LETNRDDEDDDGKFPAPLDDEKDIGRRFKWRILFDAALLFLGLGDRAEQKHELGSKR
jgi:hypothetical protein